MKIQLDSIDFSKSSNRQTFRDILNKIDELENIANVLNGSGNSTYGRKISLNQIGKRGRKRRSVNVALGRQRWTRDQDNYLRTNAGKKPLDELANGLKRSPKAVSVRAANKRISLRIVA